MGDIRMKNDDNNDKMAELKAFDASQLGVKGLIDAGVEQLPRIFVNEQPPSPRSTNNESNVSIPVIDLGGVESLERRGEIMKEVSDACEKWGFFQAVNHGIPENVLDEMIKGARRFHELDSEVKKSYYVRGDNTNKKFVYTSNFYLYTGSVTNWRDTDIMLEYGKYIEKLGSTFLELLSEAMGLKPEHLKGMDCAEDYICLTHYYPPCPQPELAVGINKHADNDTLTILLQDQIGGLQVLHDNQWYDVPHIPGALLLSNDKYKSVIHRVQSKKVGPRISVACFFRPKKGNPRLLAPIKDILSEENPPIYRETTIGEYLANYISTGQDYGVQPSLERFKL
ncbi:1-aminocyclopropane-1-carboxylate oxidase-like protein 1 [Bienertia sinuspersici]